MVELEERKAANLDKLDQLHTALSKNGAGRRVVFTLAYLELV